MRIRPGLTRTAVLATLLCAAASPAASQPVALFPASDRSGEAYGEVFSRFLTAMVFEKLEEDGWSVVIVNPGGLYSPTRDPWAPDRASAPGVKAVVLPLLAQARRKSVKDDRPLIVVSAAVVDATTGASREPLDCSKEVKRKDLEKGFDVGSWWIGHHFWTGIPYAVYKSSRRISKQPLGKAVIAIAEALQPRIAAHLEAMGLTRGVPPPSGDACSVEFGVRYVNQGAASRSYTVLVNGLEESARVANGKLLLPDVSGSLVFEVSVRDAPFRLPVQPLYFANTIVDCSRPERTLTLEVGPAGEGLLVWR